MLSHRAQGECVRGFRVRAFEAFGGGVPQQGLSNFVADVAELANRCGAVSRFGSANRIAAFANRAQEVGDMRSVARESKFISLRIREDFGRVGRASIGTAIGTQMPARNFDRAF